jgi:hypothetical protein
MKGNILSMITDDVSLDIITELHQNQKPLSVYDFKETYSLAQYRYALRRLQSYLILSSFRKKRRFYYTINPLYEGKLSTLLELSTNLTSYPSFASFVPLLKRIEGWALAGSTALDHLVPFLYLSGGKYSFCVRSVKEKEKVAQYIPRTLLDIQIQPTYFIKHPKIIQVADFPILAPEILLFQLLRHDNARISLASLFLLPYISPQTLISRMETEKTWLPTLVYLIICIQEYLRELPSSSPLRIWFYNINQYDRELFFQQYLKHLASSKEVQRKKSRPIKSASPFSILRTQWKKKMKDYSKWDLLAEMFNEKWRRFTPEALEALYSTEDFYRKA